MKFEQTIEQLEKNNQFCREVAVEFLLTWHSLVVEAVCNNQVELHIPHGWEVPWAQALLEMMNLEEYKAHHKVLKLVKEMDWTTIANVVNVLKIFYEITLHLSHASACIS